jgi:hypothetical protein
VTRRDRSIRHALDKLAIAERYAREASVALASADSYDDRQLDAVLLQCATCDKSYWVRVARKPLTCAWCRK